MDPNSALNNIREAVGELRNQDDDGVLDGSQVGFLLESVEALDEWLKKGGFPPSDWRTSGEQYFVEILYNTDPEGKRVDYDDWSNRTLHGPFASEDDAHTWLDTHTDGDKDVKDVTVGLMNKADPARPFVNALPGEPEPRASGTCRHCGRSIVLDSGTWIDLEATGDDRIWRETCDSHDTMTAEHEPMQHEHTHEFQGQRLVHSHPHSEPHGYFEHPEDIGAPREDYSVEVYFELSASDAEEAFKTVHDFLHRREADIRYAGMHYELLEGAAARLTENGRED